MSRSQCTIKTPVTVSGVGLHTGKGVSMTFRPAEEGTGYRFRRIDLKGNPEVQADIDNVRSVERGTTIEENNVTVHTVEHALAALAGLELDNVLVELDSPETPIMDGSAAPFVHALQQAGVQQQRRAKTYFVPAQPVRYRSSTGKTELIAMPDKDYRLTVMVDYNSSILDNQHATLGHIRDFKKEIAPCRTFCFLHELEALYAHNLIKGGDLDNAIVLVDQMLDKQALKRLSKLFGRSDIAVKREGVLNNVNLHHPNEPARHKLLDVIGDLALLGVPLQAHVIASRPGHKYNVAFTKKLKMELKQAKRKAGAPDYDPNKKPVVDINQIKELLPHRHPFLLIDKVIELSDEHVVGIKNVTINEGYFPGHFPDNPVMPGVLQIEAMAQTGGVLVLNTVPDPENYNTYFLKIRNARFKRKVVPGDTLILKLKLLSPIRRGLVEMKGVAYVGHKVAAEAELMAQISKKK